jgi:hypothetical protein
VPNEIIQKKTGILGVIVGMQYRCFSNREQRGNMVGRVAISYFDLLLN